MLLEQRKKPCIKAVLFDLDNTLYDRDLAFESWARDFISTHFEAADHEEALRQLLRMDARGHRTRPALFARFLSHYPTLPYKTEALCNLFYEGWLTHMEMPSASHRLLDRLNSAGIPFGIVTNGPVHQNLKIDCLGLRSRTNCIYISGVFGSSKPEAAIFQAAAAALNTEHGRVLFIGDNPDADICGAKAAGMFAAWLHRGASWPEMLLPVQPDFTIGSLDDLPHPLF